MSRTSSRSGGGGSNGQAGEAERSKQGAESRQVEGSAQTVRLSTVPASVQVGAVGRLVKCWSGVRGVAYDVRKDALPVRLYTTTGSRRNLESRPGAKGRLRGTVEGQNLGRVVVAVRREHTAKD